MSLRELPARPNLEHLKKQARLLLRGYLQAEVAAIDRFREVDVTYSGATPKLAGAQNGVGSDYGLADWATDEDHVGSCSDGPMEAFTAAIKANEAAVLRQV